MRKILSILTKFLFFISFIFFISLSGAKAGLEFESKQKITYQIGSRGEATVIQEISLVNNFSNIYPKEYHIKINGNKIKNITASDDSGNILNEVIESLETTTIKLSLNQENVGKGKSTTFRISYSITQFAVKKGQVWELSIPSISNIEEIDDLELEIKVPLAFGSLSYSSLAPAKKENQEKQQIILYQKSQLKQSPLVLAFGDFQIFDFSLNFSLKNQNREAVRMEIPIPPDTAYQAIILSQIKPEPIKIRFDQDYNWLAEYLLEADESKNIEVKGQAKIFSQPNNQRFLEAQKRQSDFSIYLKEDLYWETNNPIMKELAQKHSTSRKIFDFVVQSLEYDYQNLGQLERKGALKAYQSQKGVCTEFSDLFVTLARSSGIPSRELEGFTFTDNQKLLSLSVDNDILHSWAEYWDNNRKTWVPVDPTWSKTTGGMDFLNNFDLGHFVFVTHGQSSTKPIPPGFYKDNENQKNIDVKFAQKLIPFATVDLVPEIKQAKKEAKIVIKNKSLLPAYKIRVNLKGWQNKDSQTEEISFIPPLGEGEIIINPPGILSRIFSKPSYKLIVNDSPFEINYPKIKLNFWSFFANLFKK